MTSQLPTVDIKGRDYVLVKDRVLYFNEAYPEGMIQTDLTRYENGQVIVLAKVWPDAGKLERYYTGWSQAKENDGYINKSSALENAETSAVGRALAMMGIGVIESIASADEMVKATTPTHNSYGDEEKEWESRVSAEPEAPKTQEEKDIDDSLAESTEPTKKFCATCGELATYRTGVSKKNGKPWAAYFCTSEDKSHVEWL